MTISGFTFVRNAVKLYYPVKEAIESVLPIVEEFIIALGNCDADDKTLKEIESINSPKIKIIHTTWDTENYKDGTEYAHQTNIAKEACKGDWLFYIQCDECIHEKDYDIIKINCKKYLYNLSVDGFLFQYRHFWGDYQHYIISHGWYAKEIRIIRNVTGIYSWKDAQSFRKGEKNSKEFYTNTKDTLKLNVIELPVSVFHYGWVRPPELMNKKRKSFISDYSGKDSRSAKAVDDSSDFNYGDLSKLKIYSGSHPSVMKNRIAKLSWQSQLNTFYKQHPVRHKHDFFKYKLLTWFEQNLNGGEQIFAFKNYNRIKIVGASITNE